MQTEIGAVPMDDPIAYFITWSTYGTWLPGDEAGGSNTGMDGSCLTRSGNSKQPPK